MGLDIYLKAERYVSGYDHSTDEEKGKFAALLDVVGLSREDIASDSPGGNISVTVGYWRKANAIHAWFVQNVQNGEDECRPHYVSHEDLERLKADCLKALANKDKAGEIMPPQAGFFFGSTELDEWYYKDLEATVAIVDRCLNEKFERFSFEYESSW